MMRIFGYFHHSFFGVLSRVTKRWRMIAHDGRLWTSVSFRQEYNGLKVKNADLTLPMLIQTRFANRLKYLEIGWDLITINILEELARNCPSLSHLTLDFSNAMQLQDYLELNNFPANLNYLCICLSDVIFMDGLVKKIFQYLGSVKTLHLIGTFETSTMDETEALEVININQVKRATPNVTVLNLYGVTFVDDTHVEFISHNCLHLQCLSLSFCLQVKGKSFRSLLRKCPKLSTLLLHHCGLEDEYMMQPDWSTSHITELDLTSVELSAACLDYVLMRSPNLTYLSVGHCDFFDDNVMIRLLDNGKFDNIKYADFSFTPMLNEDSVVYFLSRYGSQLEGLMLSGKPQLAEYFWTKTIPLIANIRFRCSSLEAFTVSDGPFYEMVKSNFERARKYFIVRTMTSYNTSLVRYLTHFKQLLFN